MVLVITGVASKEVLERWTFDIQTDKAVVAGRWVLPVLAAGPSTMRSLVGHRGLNFTKGAAAQRLLHACSGELQPSLLSPCCALPTRSAPLPQKSEAQITQEIQAIIRQITASVTFLPLLSDKCERFVQETRLPARLADVVCR